MYIELTPGMAHAILDVEDIVFNEGLGPADDRKEAWDHLVETASTLVNRNVHWLELDLA